LNPLSYLPSHPAGDRYLITTKEENDAIFTELGAHFSKYEARFLVKVNCNEVRYKLNCVTAVGSSARQWQGKAQEFLHNCINKRDIIE